MNRAQRRAGTWQQGEMGPHEDVLEGKLLGQVDRETFPGNFPLAFSTGKMTSS